MKSGTITTRPSIRIARSAGFCFGVRRAITLAEKTAANSRPIYTFGPLIHNPQEVDRLAAQGIRPLKTPGRLTARATLILRTHGIPAHLREQLERKKLTLVDATCPFVKRAQDIVRKLSDEDCRILIVGERTHPEVIALVSYGKGKCRVVEDAASVKDPGPDGRICVVSQTTQTPQNFRKVLSRLKRTGLPVTAYNTICRATIDRQNAASRLARRVDVMIVIGGKNSGNTRRLAEICQERTRTYHIETPAQVKRAWFTGVRSIGLTAGASTPDWIIEQVRCRIESFFPAKKQAGTIKQ